jgi:Xaa-Pro aminopeptidase
MIKITNFWALMLMLSILVANIDSYPQEARHRWEMMNQIRQDKFDIVLPEVMRENQIDMWITVMKEGNYGPLYKDFGQGYVSDIGFYIFTDRGGDRIERAALGIHGYLLEQCGAYDIFGSVQDLKAFVKERNPKRIGINMSEKIGAADSLSHMSYLYLKRTLGEPFSHRLVPADKLVSDFRSRRVASEIVAFGQAGLISKEIAERALSNEVITPGKTMLEDVAWWIMEELLRRGLRSSFDMPSIYITGPDGIEDITNRRIIQPGDLIMIDWGIGLMNLYTDMKRIAYVLKEGEKQVPPGIQHAFNQGVKVREIIRKNIKVGPTAAETLKLLNKKLEEAGFAIMKKFNQPTKTKKTEVIVGCHSVGNWGHGIGPSIALFNPKRLTFNIKPTNMFVIEFFAYTAAPEWGGKKVRIPLEDDAIVTEKGIQWLYPISNRILLIR